MWCRWRIWWWMFRWILVLVKFGLLVGLIVFRYLRWFVRRVMVLSWFDFSCVLGYGILVLVGVLCLYLGWIGVGCVISCWIGLGLVCVRCVRWFLGLCLDVVVYGICCGWIIVCRVWWIFVWRCCCVFVFCVVFWWICNVVLGWLGCGVFFFVLVMIVWFLGRGCRVSVVGCCYCSWIGVWWVVLVVGVFGWVFCWIGGFCFGSVSRWCYGLFWWFWWFVLGWYGICFFLGIVFWWLGGWLYGFF